MFLCLRRSLKSSRDAHQTTNLVAFKVTLCRNTTRSGAVMLNCQPGGLLGLFVVVVCAVPFHQQLVVRKRDSSNNWLTAATRHAGLTVRIGYVDDL